MACYRPLPLAFVRGEGAWLIGEDGQRYLDAVGGIAVCALGHAHPHVARALSAQVFRLWHTSNLYRIPAQQQLAERLAALSGLERVFFCNSGAEANEAALKLSRLYARRRGVCAPRVLVARGGFHGRTLGVLAAGYGEAAERDFGPLAPGFVQVDYGDVAALAEVDCAEEVVAVWLEPVQGEGGVRVPPPGYLRAVRRLCDERGWLLMLDEVQTGLCRTGAWFCYQHEEVLPDVLTLAKALGNGMPIGACLARGEAAGLFTPGSHGSTFGGNPLAATAALAVLEVMHQQQLAARAAELGETMLAGLRAGLDGRPGVREVRGKGLMLGIELDHDCRCLVAQALQRQLLINVTAERVVRLLPPLILSEDQARYIVREVVALIEAHLQAGGTPARARGAA